MAAVASTSMMNGHEPEKDPKPDHSPSRFTAVNGTEPPTSGTAAPPRVFNDALNNEAHRESSDNWGRSEYSTPSQHGDHDQDDQQSMRSSSSASVPSRNKRKRSEFDEQQETLHESLKGSKSPATRLDDALDSHTQPSSSNSIVLSHGDHEFKNISPPILARPDRNEDSRTPSSNATWHEYNSQLISQAQRAQQIDASDAQLAEVLQRESQGDTAHKNWGAVNRPGEGSAQSEQQSSSLSPFAQERSQAAVQVAPKRKRVFSNRTKTGCMTCRRRKKKCDEQHPACNNCIRGGFLCEGYSSRSTWQKPSSTMKTPVPLQSKEGLPDISSQYAHEMSQQQHERQQNLTEQHEPGKMRPVVVDENDRATAQFSASPTGVNSSRAPSWPPKRPWPGPGQPSYIPEHIAKPDYRDVPPIHELSREGHPKADYQIVPSIRELPPGTHQKPGMPLFQSAIEQRPAHTNNMDTSSPQAQARMALSIEHQLSARTVSGEEAEKDKMIRGELYRPFDVHLVEERERCKAALWRFNNACNPFSGLTTKEQNRLLKEVLVPPSSVVSSPSGGTTSPRPTGSIGQGTVVEAPFKCHYGYNIRIGEDVMISENCLFVDDCPITIGSHTWIGPRVTILSSMALPNMQERKGSQSRYQGRPVTIEEDCYVGAGCTIYPGVRLRRGAYVAPGEVVKSDIVAYGFQGLKPSYM